VNEEVSRDMTGEADGKNPGVDLVATLSDYYFGEYDIGSRLSWNKNGQDNL